MSITLRYLCVVSVLLFSAQQLIGQGPPRHQGIILFERGEFPAAVKSLENGVKQKELKANAEMWNYLGLAHFKNNDFKKARKALEKAVDMAPRSTIYRSNLAYVYLYFRQIDKAQSTAEAVLRDDPNNLPAFYVVGTADLWEGDADSALSTAEKMIAVDPKHVHSYLLKSDALMAKLGERTAAGAAVRDELDLLRQGIETLEAGISNVGAGQAAEPLRTSLEGMKAIYEHYSRERPVAGAPPESGITPYKILSKPKAQYTDKARQAGVSGTIKLAVLLGANGKVTHILKLKGLGYGLDEQAVRAASQIEFEPKMKDGKPVSTVVTIEYGFEIY